MSDWDVDIFHREATVDFLDELADLDDSEVIQAVSDACTLVSKHDDISEDEYTNGLAAATIAAIWAGAPFSSGDIADEYPFIRDLTGSTSEELAEVAAEILEDVVEDEDLDPFIEALS